MPVPNPPLSMNSASYRLPVDDQAFLLREELRGVRFQLEYQKAELVLRDWGIRSTIVVFGSARAPSPERLLQAKAAGLQQPDIAPLSPLAHWYEEARRFGRLVSLEGGALVERDGGRNNVIATGGGPGIMEAANRGAAEAGAPTIGFNISLPREQQPNPYTTPELTLRFHYFAMRKMHLAMRANALVVFPGGFGTFDELFELLTLLQTRKAPPAPVVLVGADYWSRVVDFQLMIDHGLIGPEDLALFETVDDADAAWASLRRRGLKAHNDGHQPSV